MNETPYAVFRFHGAVVELNQRQFEQCLRDSRHCRCGDCLVCRVREYHQEATNQTKGD